VVSIKTVSPVPRLVFTGTEAAAPPFPPFGRKPSKFGAGFLLQEKPPDIETASRIRQGTGGRSARN
jgi:hypothetical protein